MPRRDALTPLLPLLLALSLTAIPLRSRCRADDVPHADHVIVIVMENHSYDQARIAPYTAGLIAQYSSCSASYALTHPSQPNYIALWSGAFQGVTNDNCPPAGAPYSAENLGHACEAAGLTWRAYSEGLPSVGYAGCSATGGYVRRHCPWTHFSNLNHQNERPYTDLALDIAADALPNLAFVIPNQCNNTHDCPVTTGDTWLANNVPAMIAALGPNGCLILTWDEDDSGHGNHILTLFAGPTVKSGFVSPGTVTHYNVLRTICEAIGIAPMGAATTRNPITDIWELPSSTVAPGAGAIRILSVAPNPSNSEFRISFANPAASPVQATVLDPAGRRVEVLDSAGTEMRWDGHDADGTAALGGVYFLRLVANDQVLERKLILIR